MHKVFADTLNDAVDFDHPFNLTTEAETGGGRAMFRDSDDYPVSAHLGYAPDVSVDAEVDKHGDAHVTGDAWISQPVGRKVWSFYSRGYTQQSGVKRNDPVMHPSEYLGGKLAQDMITEGGTFVVTTVSMSSDEEYDGDDLVGWVVLRKGED